MKLFNLDAHCSVITDVQKQLGEVGHSVDSYNLTGHHWAMGLPARPTWGRFKLDFIWSYGHEKCKAEHGEELKDYDAFLGCYPPPLIRMFDGFGKPLILHMPVRYDLWTSDNEERWRSWTEWFKERHSAGQLKVSANSIYDVEYCKYFTGIVPSYIPSLCDYVPHEYVGDINTALLWDARSEKVKYLFSGELSNLAPVRSLYPKYEWATLARHKAIVHVPYNASIMAMFEHYWMGIPILVPSKEFMISLKLAYGAIGEITHRQCANNYGPGSFGEGTFDAPDPNEYNDVNALHWWMQYWDCYNLPHITTFESISDLRHKLETLDFKAISAAMKKTNQERKLDVVARWKNFMEAVK